MVFLRYMQESVAYDDLKEKTPWMPTPDEQAFTLALKNQWQRDYEDHVRPYDFFQRKNLDSWMKRNEEDSYALYRETRKEPWRSNARMKTVQQKIYAIIAAAADLNLQPEVRSFSMYGSEIQGMGDGIEGLLEHAHILDNDENKRKWRYHYLLTQGTISENVRWQVMNRTLRPISKDNFTTGECEFTDSQEEKREGRIFTQITPLNRIILGDVTQQDINLQPHTWSEYITDYDVTRTMYGKWKNWKHVIPISNTSANIWMDSNTQSQTEDSIQARKCRIRVYEDIWRNVYAVFINDVLLTQPNRPMPGKSWDKMYSHTWTPLLPLSAHFAYGGSLCEMLHNDAFLRDFFYNALVDTTRQDIEPPLVTSYRNIVNRFMFRPGAVTPVGKDFKLEHAIIRNGGENQAMVMLKFIEENIEKSSVPNIVQGQQGSAQVTAYQIREQIKNALRTMFIFFSAMAEAERQKAVLEIRNIAEYYPTLGVGKIDSELSKLVGGIRKVFMSKGTVTKDGMRGDKQVAFVKNMDNLPTLKIKQALMRDEAASRILGSPRKWHLIDPETMAEAKHLVYVIINPSQRKSKQADEQEAREKNLAYRDEPLISPEWRTRRLLTSQGEDPNEAMVKQDQQQPQQTQPGQPGGPPAVPGQQSTNSNPLAATETRMKTLARVGEAA